MHAVDGTARIPHDGGMDLDVITEFDAGAPFERARTPPSPWYREAAVLRLERERVFGRHWSAVARAEQVASPGAYVAGQLADQPFVVVRGEDGALRAFHNVCRHHATAVADGVGSCAELVCPYHGWTYGLDGALRKAPRLGRVEGFDVADFGLAPMNVAAWGPLVFVSLSDRPRDLARDVAPLEARVSAESLSSLRFVERRTYRLRCNWKVFCDNYLDGGYHVPHMHRELAVKLDLDAYSIEVFDRMSIQGSPGTGDARLGDDAVYAFMHPNLMINRYGPWLDVDVVTPVDAETCEVTMEWWLDDAAGLGEAEIARQLMESERVQAEDVTVSESVQRGLRSVSYRSGRYAAPERAMYEFHRWLHEDFTTSQ